MPESQPRARSISQPDDHPAIQEFLIWINAPATRRVGCSGSDNDIVREYISWRTLQEKLTKSKVEELLETLFENCEYPRPEADYVTKHYLRPFAILLCIGQGRMIHHFSEHQNLQDHLLPLWDEPPTFPKSTVCNIFADFRRIQWEFCAVKLEYDIRTHLEPDYILPINSKELIEEGGSAIAYKIEVDADYDELVPATEEGLETPEEHRNTYVIKTYRSGEAQIYYKTERNAFEKLRYSGLPPANIIGFYGSFVREQTYNIILEYADLGTLDDYMKHTAPPSSAEDKMIFWDRFFDVGHGLATIHGEDGHDNDGPQILLGWHQDVNPSNILVKSYKGRSRYDCHFKLADLGLSHFKKHTSSPRDATDVDTWGTNAYGISDALGLKAKAMTKISLGAPETYRANAQIEKRRLKVKQDVDIWSIGCVYSEVATWVDQGWNKVVEYRRRRLEEMKARTNQSVDSFHDGLAVLGAVKQIHSDIVQNHRPNDFVTPKVVEKLVTEMLLVRSARPDARYLYDMSRRIVDDAHLELKQVPSYPVSPTTARRPPVEPISPTYGSRQFSEELYAGGPVNPDSRTLNSESPFPDIAHGRGLNSAPSGEGKSYPSSHTQSEHLHQHTQSDSAFTYSKLAQMSKMNGHNGSDQNVGRPSQGNNWTETDQRGMFEAREALLQPPPHTGSSKRHTESTSSGGEAPNQVHKQQQSSQSSTNSASAAGAEGPSQALAKSATFNSRIGTSSGRVNGIQTPPPDLNAPPHMTVEDGLVVKMQRELGKKVPFPPEDKYLFENLHQRDHAFLIDNSNSMESYRPQARKVLELLSYMLGPTDPDGLDMYFTTYPKKLKPRNSNAMLAEFDKRKATGHCDMRQRFANILEDYQKKFGKWNFLSKLLHPNATPSKGPRKFTLYVLTDGVWQQNITLVEEMKTLVKHMTNHNIPNKHIGIQFIRFGDHVTGMKRLKKLDSKRRLGVELDLVDTTPADGNVWKMLLGPLNPWFDDDTEEEDDDEDDDDYGYGDDGYDGKTEEGLGINTSGSVKGKGSRRPRRSETQTGNPSNNSAH